MSSVCGTPWVKSVISCKSLCSSAWLPEGASPPDQFQKSFLSEHFILEILRVREAVGIHHQNVSLGKFEQAGLV